MLGYNLLGYSALMELEREHALVTVPIAVTVTFQPKIPNIATGKGVFPTALGLVWSPKVPSIRGGASAVIPTPTLRFEPEVPLISISAKIYPGYAQTRWVPQAPDIYAGKSVMASAKTVTFIPYVPVIRAGKTVIPDPAVITFLPQPPLIAISAKVYPVPAQTRWAPQPPEIKAGNVIFVGGGTMLPYDLGGLGDWLPGGASIFEGEIRYKRSSDDIPKLRLMTRIPKISGGAMIAVPVTYISFSPKPFEVASRSRKLRTSVVCS